ncbi:MAG: hypothetical protein JWQ14_2130 [Adhaeribacter sp.]|nr:hypothetical protein [Adhaeribacter sp.]
MTAEFFYITAMLIATIGASKLHDNWVGRKKGNDN